MSPSDAIRFYGGMIWTDHALSRIKLRKLSSDQILSVMKNPDKTYPGKKPDTVKFIRTLDNREIHVVAKMNPDRQWVVLTVFVRGEEDQWPLPERIVFGAFGLVARVLKWLLMAVVHGVKRLSK